MTNSSGLLHTSSTPFFSDGRSNTRSNSLPGVSNEFIYLIKYSSLAYVVAVIELPGVAKIIASKYFMYFEAFAAVGIFYLVLVTITTFGVTWLEKKYAIPGVSGAVGKVTKE